MAVRNPQYNIALIIFLFATFLASSAVAADALRINPMRLDCGVIEEGVPATMLVTIENIGAKNVNITSVKTN